MLSAAACAQTPAVADRAAAVEVAAVEAGAADTAAYMPLLRGRRVAVLANHTAMFSESEHLVDMLCRCGARPVGIFSPEHGFRGRAEAGASVGNSVDERTGVPILSLYDGRTQRPSDEAMRSFDVLVVDMQDVGLRFYTYYISMIRMMDACADFGREVIVLDRPNPNGDYVDGPILDMRFKSGVGWLPIPVVHGMTMGELARMAVGEGWCKRVGLSVVRCRNYDHRTSYVLPVAPSPNLPTQHSIYLYASMCLFEGTVVSLGRGTDFPFEVYGHPDMKDRDFSFTPRPNAASTTPPLSGRVCHGVDLRGVPDEQIRREGLTLRYVVDAYRDLDMGERFFTPMFEKLIGVDWVRRMIVEGASAEQIEACWRDDVEQFRQSRRAYLLYEE
ncbi:MAG: DUF1343 domain-containing protein [Alistipes sp.]|nr:DUF1343 domain-containing protein [Alistipes sp.]